MDIADSKFNSCLISAPFSADLGVLPRVLDRAGIHWEWAKSELAYSERLPGDLRKMIRRVDCVIGVLFGGITDANTLFEVGVAVGIGKPVLLIIAQDKPVSQNVDALPHVQVSLTDENVIALHLDLLMRSTTRGFRYAVSGQARSTASVSKSRIRKDTHVTGDRQATSAFEKEIADLIEKAGGQVLFHPRLEYRPQKFVPDLLTWLPTSDAELLNPAVVEFKNSPLEQTSIGKAEEQLFTYLQDTGVRTGLIVGSSVEPKAPIEPRGSSYLNVFFLDTDNFLALLQTGKLGRYLRDERNRAAHGLR